MDLLETGTKFIVETQNDEAAIPLGSEGFIECFCGFDSNIKNMAYYSVIVTKRGRHGKPRLTQATITTYMVELPKDAYDLIKSKFGEKYITLLETILEPKEEFKRATSFVKLRKADSTRDFAAMTQIDKLGFLCATVSHYRKVCEDVVRNYESQGSGKRLKPASKDIFANTAGHAFVDILKHQPTAIADVMNDDLLLKHFVILREKTLGRIANALDVVKGTNQAALHFRVHILTETIKKLFNNSPEVLSTILKLLV